MDLYFLFLEEKMKVQVLFCFETTIETDEENIDKIYEELPKIVKLNIKSKKYNVIDTLLTDAEIIEM